MHRIAEYLSKRLDLLGGIVGGLIGVVIAAVGYITKAQATAEMGVTVLVACAIYLLFRKKMADSSSPSLPSSTSLTLVLNIIFICALAASISVAHFSLYRPPIYFLLISISVAAVAAEILSSEGKMQTWLLLLKILLISLSLRAGLFYELPGLVGWDAWSHVGFIGDWTDSGHIISERNIYAKFPVMHLAVIATRLITSLNLKDSMFLSIGIFNIISILFVFLIGQRLLDRKGGLLAALFISICVLHISWGVILIPNSLGLVIFTMILFLVFKSTSSVTNSLLFVVLAVTLVLTHTISAFITSISLAVILMANEVYKKIDRANVEGIYIGYNTVGLFVVLMLVRWIYCFYGPAESFFDTVLGWFVDALRTDVELIGTTIYVESVSTLSSSPLNRVWFLMSMGFTVIGSLFWLSRRMRCNLKIAVITSALVLSIAVFIFPVFNIWNLLPDRWIGFVQVICAVLVANGILLVSGIVKDKIKKAGLVVIIFFVFSMFSINCGIVNCQTPFYEEHSRPAFTPSEIRAIDTISRTYDGTITTDSVYRLFAFSNAGLVFGIHTKFTELAYLNPEVESEGVVVIRKYLYTHPCMLGYGGELSGFFSKFDSLGYDTIYNNGEVKAHLSKSLLSAQING